MYQIEIVGRYDLIYIQREAFPWGPPFLERIYRQLNKNLVLDLDDATFLGGEYIGRWRLFLNDKFRVQKLFALARCVVVGNDFVGNEARKYNSRVYLIPTAIDGDLCRPPEEKKASRTLTIGWIGTRGNTRYLEIVRRALQTLANEYDFIFKIVGGDTIYDFELPNVNIIRKIWKMEDAISDLQSFDIGIMPLLDTEWERGKSGFKIIEYMAVGIPAVASDVGFNRQIIEHGINGFLVKNECEWYETLLLLLRDPHLRSKIGKKGRKTFEERFSTKVVSPMLEKIVHKVLTDTMEDGEMGDIEEGY